MRRDPRFHIAIVVLTIHTFGQLWLGFTVSVPQIAAAIVTCGLIDVAVTYVRDRRIVWPASALLTGSGVALVLRDLGTARGDHWSTDSVLLFALVAAGSLATKYLFTRAGRQMFNPSNVGLVVAFLILGSGRVEPLDLWWAPMGPAMLGVYMVLGLGGAVITARLKLFEMAVAYWLTLVAGVGLLAVSGHSITARWSLVPVSGTHFWWVVITSPEVLILMWFMITNPPTIPEGRRARVEFAVTVSVLATLLMAPQGNEFNTKVALLGSLTIVSPFNRLFDRAHEPEHEFRIRPAVASLAALSIAAAIVVAGLPARTTVVAPDLAFAAAYLPTDNADIAQPDQVPPPVEIPPLVVSAEAIDLDSTLGEGAADDAARALLEALEAEAHAYRTGDTSVLMAHEISERLDETTSAVEAATGSTLLAVPVYRFDSLRMVVTHPFGPQNIARPGFAAAGELTKILMGPDGTEVSRSVEPCDLVFVMLRLRNGNWYLTGTL